MNNGGPFEKPSKSNNLKTGRFPCTRCGSCCRSVSESDVYKHLDRGDGACKFYQDITHDCSIYLFRPSICRVHEMYYLLHPPITWDEYVFINVSGCNALQKKFKQGG